MLGDFISRKSTRMDISENAANTKNKNEDHIIAPVIIELMEVALNMILYIRNIYPDGIFKKYRKYNMGVMLNCHPDVTNYITEVFTSLQPYIIKGQIKMVIFQIINKNGEPLERYCFEMQFFQTDSSCCYFDIEQHLIAVLLKLNVCESLLLPLPEDCSFQILAYTGRSTLRHMEDTADFPKCPWIVAEDKVAAGTSKDMEIVPLRSCSNASFVVSALVLKEFPLVNRSK